MTTTPTRTDDYLEVRGLRVAFGGKVTLSFGS